MKLDKNGNYHPDGFLDALAFVVSGTIYTCTTGKSLCDVKEESWVDRIFFGRKKK